MQRSRYRIRIGAILVAGKLGGAILHFFSNKIKILGGANAPPLKGALTFDL